MGGSADGGATVSAKSGRKGVKDLTKGGRARKVSKSKSKTKQSLKNAVDERREQNIVGGGASPGGEGTGPVIGRFKKVFCRIYFTDFLDGGEHAENDRQSDGFDAEPLNSTITSELIQHDLSLGNGTILVDAAGDAPVPKVPERRPRYNSEGSSFFPSIVTSSPGFAIGSEDISMASLSEIGDEDLDWLPIGISWRDFDEGEFQNFPVIAPGVIDEPTDTAIRMVNEVSPPKRTLTFKSKLGLAKAINKLASVFIDLATGFMYTKRPFLHMGKWDTNIFNGPIPEVVTIFSIKNNIKLRHFIIFCL